MTQARLLPLCAARDDASPIAYTAQGPASVAQFMADVRALATRLPREAAILNFCQDRYRFMVGLMAAVSVNRVSLLPASHTPAMVAKLREFAPDIICLHDGGGRDIDLEQVLFNEPFAPVTGALDVPVVDEAQVVAYLFTSGSTGAPVAHCKTWGSLVDGALAERQRLDASTRSCSIVGTVPSQHMYGFESTVLLSLHGHCSAWSGRPFYPADIAAVLAKLPRPRMLVTTPFHLQSLLHSGVEVPPLDILLSATAPLSPALAREAETRLCAPLYEIFGSTETGQIAHRRTIDSPVWHLLPGVRLSQDEGRTFAHGGHVLQRTEVADVIELCGDEQFLLHGRHADLINIAGKRTSLAYLNHHLNSIEFVEDGTFYCPPAAAGSAVERLCAFVVAPNLAPAKLLAELRLRIEPVFLPRPLVFLDKLPRNATGKLPRAELQALLDHYRAGQPPTQRSGTA